MVRRIQNLLLGGFTATLLISCGTGKLTTYNVAYQSVKTKHVQPSAQNPIPNEAAISVAYSISSSGDLTAVVFNRTSEIMTIDQTKSFFVNSDGKSTSYYDPTVRATSTSDLSSTTRGASVNLGAISGALGIGGTLGSLLNGINVGGSNTSGTTITNTSYVADQPQVSLAPHSNGAMSKVFNIIGVGAGDINGNATSITESLATRRFSVCISYSIDGGKTFNKLVTCFFVDSELSIPVEQHGQINSALRKLLTAKPDALHEPWWVLHFNSNYKGVNENALTKGLLVDYQ